MNKLKVPSLLTTAHNMRYFTGFTGEGFAFVGGIKNVIFTDSRYTEQAKIQTGAEVIEYSHADMWNVVSGWLKDNGIRDVGCELESMSAADYLTLRRLGLDVNDISAEAERRRMVKSPEETESVRRACEIADITFEHMKTVLRCGISEREAAAELEYFMKLSGAESTSFDTIMASGENGSMPHAIVSDRRIAAGDMVTMDFGCKINGYCSDITRTVAIESIAIEQKRVYNIVYQAQTEALSAVKPGAVCREVDMLARRIIADAGFGKYFGHGLGHSLGLLIHETPRFNPTDETQLEPGMIITVEPGIYLPAGFGVRIEDTVLVTDTGFERLTKSDKQLIILGGKHQ